MGTLETIRFILRKGGIGAFWRGVGPALVLVINPIIQVRSYVNGVANQLMLPVLTHGHSTLYSNSSRTR